MPLARPSRCRSAFTLIELLAVLAIVAILLSLSFGALRSAKERSAIARTKGELAALAQALETYKAHYGDYPQTGAAEQATVAVDAPVEVTTAQSLLFNALTGVYGPTNFTTRLNGPVFVETSRFHLERMTQPDSFAVATGSPPSKAAMANAFLDPWSQRYRYYYRRVSSPGSPIPSEWRAPGYMLYSAGPDGRDTPPDRSSGHFSAAPSSAEDHNADNVYALR